MNHDPSSDPVDARLSALYRAHATPAEQPSAVSDARILAIAREAAARSGARPVARGWRSWLNASWFGPGLAFATIASLSVVVVSLMQKEDIAVERAVTVAPGTPPPSVRPAAPVTSAASPMQAPAPSAEAPAALSAPSASGVPQATDKQLKAKSTAAVPALSTSSAPQAADGQLKAKSVAAVPAASKSATPQAPEVEQPNPFPGHSPPGAGGRADQAAAVPGAVGRPDRTAAAPSAGGRADLAAAASAAARPPVVPAPVSPAPPAAAAAAGAAAPAQRQEKPSLLSESTESRMTANQPVPEVRDAVPTYPNEAQPSIAPPRMYATPRAPARDAASGMAAPAGSVAGGPSVKQQLPALRKEAMAERRAADKSGSPAAAASAGAAPSVGAPAGPAPAGAMMAAAPPLRDPAEWIKAIQKLRTEGKPEQVTKELSEFRRQYPLYPLPDELKQLVK